MTKLELSHTHIFRSHTHIHTRYVLCDNKAKGIGDVLDDPGPSPMVREWAWGGCLMNYSTLSNSSPIFSPSLIIDSTTDICSISEGRICGRTASSQNESVFSCLQQMLTSAQPEGGLDLHRPTAETDAQYTLSQGPPLEDTGRQQPNTLCKVTLKA